MAHSFISRFKIFPAKEALFLETCRRMEEAVARHEPEVYFYKFYRLREPNTFAVIESFIDEAADQAHQNSPHFKKIGPAMIECIDGGYVREYLDPL